MIYKRILFLFLTTSLSLPSWANIEGLKPKDNLDWAINLVFIIGLAVIIGAIFVLFKTAKTIWKTQNIARFKSEGMSHEAALKKIKQERFLSFMYRELVGGVPAEQETEILLNHDYDGIRELDNNLPPWWVGMFYATIVYAIVFIGIVHFSDFGQSMAEEYEQEVREAEIAIAAYNVARREEINKGKESESKDVEIRALTDLDRIALGEKTFKTYCVACHGKLGEGMLGLGQNLTDEYWIHGGGIENVVMTIRDGVPSTTMIAWKTTLSEDQILEVSSYILTLQGTNPPNAREPEGEKWEGKKKATE